MKNQNKASSLLIATHRIEKSMCFKNQDTGRAYERVNKLLQIIDAMYRDKSYNKSSDLMFAFETALAVIQRFICFKEDFDPNSQNYKELKSNFEISSVAKYSTNNDYAGIRNVEFHGIDKTEIYNLFHSRHSVRQFENTQIEEDKILRAVELAMTAPSACNRQPSRCYFFSDRKIAEKKDGKRNAYNAPYHIIITADCTAYDYSEYNDWIVSASIFSGFLCLALHSVGVGTCFMRKELTFDDSYNLIVRDICKIPPAERIIIELLVGNYPKQYDAPISRKKPIDEVLKIVL